MELKLKIKLGILGSSVGWVSNFGSGHDLMAREFEPRVELCADNSEPGACFRLSPPLYLPFPCSLSLVLSFSLSQNKQFFFIFLKNNRKLGKINKMLKSWRLTKEKGEDTIFHDQEWEHYITTDNANIKIK